jgi:7,8-dihydropterin-6-yl-methyl-4-(beta-D-ribofuranosyl)aminobenzene 5'-phosphate synthase
LDRLTHFKITVLCENVVGNGIGLGEHGFAVYVETDQGVFLMDTGSGLTIAYNSEVLKKDLGLARKVFLSHGHYDHTGGLLDVLERTGPVDVYGHPSIFDAKYAIAKEAYKPEKRFIGIPFRKALLEAKGARFLLDTGFQEVAKGICFTGEIPRVTDFEKGDPRLFVMSGIGLERDTVPDDQALVFSTAKGLVVLLGCAHAGIINTLRYVAEQMGGQRLHAVLGGTHLGFFNDDELDQPLKALRDFNPDVIGVSHCTGLKVAQRLSDEFGSRVIYASVGSSFEV